MGMGMGMGMLMGCVLFLCCAALGASAASDSAEFDKNVEEVVWARAGGEAVLPCDVTAPMAGDAVSMVLWFKDSTGMPLYSLDFRANQLVHWATTDDLGSRTHFVLDEARPQDAHLAISGVTVFDEGVFRCRVDFFDSPTKNHRVNLSLLVPPNEPRMFDGQGREIAGVAGPFRETYDLYLSCQVSGGRPPPTLTWYHNEEMLEGIADPTGPTGTVTSQLFIGTVTRDLHGARLQCRASVDSQLPSVAKEVQLQVYLKPQIVRITSASELLGVGRARAVACETLGSHPAARLAWLLDGEVLRSHPITVTNVGNKTSSTVTMNLTAADDGKVLTCRATNPWFPGGVLEDSRTINVAYPPKVSISVGSNADPSLLQEGGEIQLLCSAEARPAADKYSWFREEEQIYHNPADGKVVLGRTMRIRNLNKNDTGNYSCQAVNPEGRARSQMLPITVLYVPVCKAGMEAKEVAAVRFSSLSLRCEVDSPPEAGPVKFSWTYNKTRDVLPVSSSRVTSTGTTSELTYSPNTSGDFGTLACWATSRAGHQNHPCLFEVIPAKVPEPPYECTVINGSRALEVACVAGRDGGIPQHFLLEVLAAARGPSSTQAPLDAENEISTMNDQGIQTPPEVPLYRETGEAPRFALHGLRPGRKYGVLVYAVNARGRSAPARLQDVIISEALVSSADQYHKHPEEQEEPQVGQSQSMAMVLGALVAAALLILLAIISASAVVVCRRRGSGGCGASKRQSLNGPSMYGQAEDESGFGSHFGSPNVMIRPCADIRRDGRRTSRALSALAVMQEDALMSQSLGTIGQEDEDIALNLLAPRLSSPSIRVPSPQIGVNGEYASIQNLDMHPQDMAIYSQINRANINNMNPYAPGMQQPGYVIQYQGINPNIADGGTLCRGMLMNQEYRPDLGAVYHSNQGINTHIPESGTLRREMVLNPEYRTEMGSGYQMNPRLSDAEYQSMLIQAAMMREVSYDYRRASTSTGHILQPLLVHPNMQNMMSPLRVACGAQGLDVVRMVDQNSTASSSPQIANVGVNTNDLMVGEPAGQNQLRDNLIPNGFVTETVTSAAVSFNTPSGDEAKEEDAGTDVRFNSTKPDLLISQ